MQSDSNVGLLEMSLPALQAKESATGRLQAPAGSLVSDDTGSSPKTNVFHRMMANRKSASNPSVARRRNIADGSRLPKTRGRPLTGNRIDSVLLDDNAQRSPPEGDEGTMSSTRSISNDAELAIGEQPKS